MELKPGYLSLLESGELHDRALALEEVLRDCALCPRSCRVDRVKGERGFCRSGHLPIVESYCAHHGEEPVLSGTRGSGTIFFGHCNLRCVFCQNHQISQPAGSLRRNEVSMERLAAIMLELQSLGCHNINFVSPSHFAAQIVRGVEIAASKGLCVPLVYNSNGYDSIQTLSLLEGIIDIYLPDLKYSDDRAALKYSKVKDYVRHARPAIVEMKRQVGDLVVDADGIAIKGLIIRHLVLPNDLAGSEESLRFIRDEVGEKTFISTMSQYFPTHKAGRYPLVSRPINPREYEKVMEWLDRSGLENGWVQDYSSKDYYCPDFEREQPFTP
ncbi:MAG: radical SAM protein [Nitrospirae bacterium]|nr:radical SAM protein [Nitrospirota bacterium]